MTKELEPKTLVDGGVFTNRHCTDCCMIPVALAFLAVWITVMIVAVVLGEPTRILLSSNYRGMLCGDAGTPLQQVPNLWIPRPTRLDYGICVTSCPDIGDYVCNNDEESVRVNSASTVLLRRNDYYSHAASEYRAGFAAFQACSDNMCTDAELERSNRFVGLASRLQQYKCFINFYTSQATLNRCLPLSLALNQTLASAVNENVGALESLSDFASVQGFFTRGFAEVEQTWVVILICCGTCAALSCLWMLLLRWLLAPVVYLCLVLIFALLIVMGYLAMLEAHRVRDLSLPGDMSTINHYKLWQALQYTAWTLAVIYGVIVLWLLKRIRIAISIMRQGTKAFLASLGMLCVPPCVLILVVGFAALFVVSSVYIQTIGELTTGTFVETTAGFADESVDVSAYAQTVPSYGDDVSEALSSITINTTNYMSNLDLRYLHAVNFFGFLWATSFCVMFGFFAMALTVVSWYFSAVQLSLPSDDGSAAASPDAPRNKSSPSRATLRSLYAALRYHFGTILFGSLLIAIIQFIRAVALYLETHVLKGAQSNQIVRWVLVVVNCCLACIERCVRIISKNAFIVTCVYNTSFITSAGTALALVTKNILRVGVLAGLTSIATFAVKVFIVLCNMIIAYFLVNYEPLTDNRPVESGLFPLFGILLVSFVIASLFVNVYTSCVTTVLMCFLLDEESTGGHFADPELAQLLDLHAEAARARQKYEDVLKGKKGDDEDK